MKNILILISSISILGACSSEMTVCDCKELEKEFDTQLLNASPEVGGKGDFDSKKWKEEHKNELDQCNKLEEKMGRKEFNEVWQECES